MEKHPHIPSQMKREVSADNPLYIEFARQTLSPPGDDARIALFFQGYLSIVNGRMVPDDLAPQVDQNAQQLCKTVETISASPSYAANKILRCFQKQFLYRMSGTSYPYTDSDVTPWREAILEVMSTERFDEVIEDMTTRETQSNVVQRYNVLKFILAACLDDPFTPPQVMDIGCSQNLGLKKIGLNGEFEPVRVAATPNLGSATSLRKLGNHYNRAINSPIKLGRSLGIDLFDMRQENNVEWVFACSSYPSELLKANRLQETIDLQASILPGVSFLQTDVTAYKWDTSNNNFPAEDRRRYDVAFASTMMYQLTQAERETAFDNIYDHLKPNGLLVVQDFVDLIDGKLKFSGPGGDHYRYKTYIKDKRREYDVPEEIFTWKNGRCTRMQPGIGQLTIRGAGISVTELLATLPRPKAVKNELSEQLV